MLVPPIPLQTPLQWLDLLPKVQNSIEQLQQQFGQQSIQLLTQSEKISIDYPVQQYLDKFASLNFDKQQFICSKLLGIKGQYLIFEQGVINIRKFGGYQIKLSY